jgi:hypothetical protein
MGVSVMNFREEIIKNLDTLSDDALEGVLEYIQFIQEPEEVEPTEGELKAIAQGEEATPKANTSDGGILRLN